jgi:hypothetical protein
LVILTLSSRLSFKLLTEATYLNEYAYTGGQLTLLVMRAVNKGGEMKVLGIKDVGRIDLGEVDDMMEGKKIKEIFAGA